jgi:hypothetical protein
LFTGTLVRFVAFGVALLFACLMVLLGMGSTTIGARTWGYFRLTLEIFTGIFFVAFLSVIYRAIKSNTPEAWRTVKSWLPMIILMGIGILFGFWSPQLLKTKTSDSKSDYIGQSYFPKGDSAETWSPAPGEKPNLQKILQSAKSLTDEGRYEEALQRYLWYFEHSRTNDSQQGVRLSFTLSDWIDLGRLYPNARQALIEIRDGDVQKFSEGRGNFKLFMEVQSISHYLGDDNAAYSLFKQIEQRDKPLAQQCFRVMEDLLLEHGDYQKCLDYIGDPQTTFEKIRVEHERMKHFEEQSAARNEEQRKRFQEMAKTNPAFAHPFPELPKFADENFVKQMRQLIEILIATGHKADAEKIRDEAVAVLNDPWLKSAVDDMEGKFQNPKTSAEPNTSLPTTR